MMGLFKKLNVGIRLMSAFLLIAVLAGVVGVVGLSSIGTLKQEDSLLYEENTLGILYSSQAARDFQKARFSALRMTVTTGDVQRNCIMDVQTYFYTGDKSMSDYEAGIITEEDRTLYAAAAPLWTEYKIQVAKASEMVKAGQADAALSYMLNDTADTALKLQGALEKLITYNQLSAQERHEANSQTAQAATMIMLAVMAVSVAAAVGLGLVMTGSIARPVKATSAQLAKMAAGEELEEIDAKRFSGEFLGMVQNLNDVRASLNLLLDDSGMLVEAAVNGQLSTRADVARHKGSYRKIIEGVNSTLDAVIAPIREAADVLSSVAEGNLNVAVTSDFAGDYAIIKHALNGTVDALNGYITEIAEVLGEMSQGNLDVAITSDYKGDFAALKTAINNIIEALNSLISNINLAADQVASGTKQVSDGNQAISQGATEQAASIEELTASVTQIAAQTGENAANASRANELSEAARKGAVEGNLQMQLMQKAMTEINEASASIGKIIKVIDDIAFQTNILALNAAVEAARAGIHGKGFAVVAEEVRNLAGRSAKAAKETAELIEGSAKKADAGKKLADETADALKVIVERVEAAGKLVEGISVASSEQASGIEQVNSGIEQMSQVVQTNSATAQEGAAASEELSGQAVLLKDMVAQFRLKEGTNAPVSAKVPEKTVADEVPVEKPIQFDDFGKY
ncbi:MAG TPA: methyl-accepting chemotaxis protein [Clostridia bacterium]|nr:methyl-accepting chemotaxis protein [Clostridia bacterium]